MICRKCQMVLIIGVGSKDLCHSCQLGLTPIDITNAEPPERIEFQWPHISETIYGRCEAADLACQCKEFTESQVRPYYGRWNELSVEDVKFLITCGIEIDS